MKQHFGIMLAACAIGAAPALAQYQTTPASKTARHKSPAAQSKSVGADQSFVKEAAIGGLAEVQLGNLAKDKASNPDVKQFGERMATDHAKANDELKQLAQQKNVTVPTELDKKNQALVDRLSKLSGDAFDKAYMRAMVSDHKHDVAGFKRESTSGKDADVKSWAEKTLPTLQEHLTLAEQTASKVGVSGATATGTSGHHAKKHKGGSGPGR
jgi:putative membrane protein